MIGRSGKDLLHRAALDYLAAINNGDVFTKFRHNAKIMGDKNHGCAKLLFQIFHQGQNLCLNGNVKRCSRFVRQQQIGLGDKSHSNHNTLFHTAGKLVWELNSALRGNAYQSEDFCDLFIALLLGHRRIMYF